MEELIERIHRVAVGFDAIAYDEHAVDGFLAIEGFDVIEGRLEVRGGAIEAFVVEDLGDAFVAISDRGDDAIVFGKGDDPDLGVHEMFVVNLFDEGIDAVAGDFFGVAAIGEDVEFGVFARVEEADVHEGEGQGNRHKDVETKGQFVLEELPFLLGDAEEKHDHEDDDRDGDEAKPRIFDINIVHERIGSNLPQRIGRPR